MYNRSLSPDSISSNLKMLAGLIKTENNLLKKSKDSGHWQDHVGDLTSSRKGLEIVGKTLYESFLDCLNDFNGGHINQALYTSHLRKFDNLFQIKDLKKSNLPGSLRADIIIKEIARFI